MGDEAKAEKVPLSSVGGIRTAATSIVISKSMMNYKIKPCHNAGAIRGKIRRYVFSLIHIVFHFV